MFARNSTSLERERSESLGWKPSNTPSWVSSVSREFRSQPYSPSPEERFAAGDALHVGDVHPAAAHHIQLGLAEVLADGADDAHLLEEGGRQREMHGGAAEHPLALAEGRLDGVIGDRSDHCDWHGRGP